VVGGPSDNNNSRETTTVVVVVLSLWRRPLRPFHGRHYCFTNMLLLLQVRCCLRPQLAMAIMMWAVAQLVAG